MQDGAELTNPMQMTFVTGTDPGLLNTKLAPNNVQIHTQTVAPGAVTIPPYSVGRLEWCVLPGGGYGYLGGGMGDGSALCGDHDDADERGR